MSTSDTMRTITLTGKPPVRIREADWGVIAWASFHDYDGQYDFQANRNWRGSLRVRQHGDGRAIVYATWSYESQCQGERGYAQRAGELLVGDRLCDVTKDAPSDPSDLYDHRTRTAETFAEIIAAIKRVHATIDPQDDAHAEQWRLLAAECIADLPAQEI